MADIQTTENAAQGMAFRLPTAEEMAVLYSKVACDISQIDAEIAAISNREAPTKEDLALAKRLDTILQKASTAVEKTRAKEKRIALDYGNVVQSSANVIQADLELRREITKAVLTAHERAEAARIAALVAQRRELCGVYCAPSDAMLAAFAESEFNDYLSGAKQRLQAAAREAEAERQRIEADAQAERERIAAQAAENARLKAEADKAAAEIAAQAKALAEEKQARDRDAREAQEREWAAKEATDRAAAAAAFAEKQKVAAEIAAAEQAAKIAAMEKAEAERKAREAQAAAEREAQRLAEEKQRAKLQKAYTALATERERMIAAAGLLFDAPESEARTAAIWAILKVVM